MSSKLPTGRSLRRRSGCYSAPLSYAQERMWFLDQLEPGTTLYTGVRPTRWKGALDVEALERSLSELLRRHEILRTCFPLRAAGPVQEIDPPCRCRLPQVGLSIGNQPPLEAVYSWLRAESRRPFRLSEETPFRATLLRITPEDHVLALTIHHIAFDRWSRSVLLQELLRLYAAYASGHPSPLPDLPLQYQDYAVWQRERIQDADIVRSLEYWRNQLRSAPATLQVPADHSSRGSRGHLGRHVEKALNESLVEELGAISRPERVSVFMTLLCGFLALLARITGQTDLVVGVPIAGRRQLELSGLIGCFTNTLVLRIDASGDPSFRELLDRVRRVCLAGYTHQEFPFEQLVRELQPERKLGQHPLFQVLFNYLDFQAEPLSPPGIEVEELEMPSETALVDVSVDIRRAGAGLACSFSCNAELFEPSTVNRLAQEYLAALETLVFKPDLPISAIPAWRRGPEPTGADSLIDRLEQITDEEAERLLEAELRSGLR
jgi:hypothetical protein